MFVLLFIIFLQFLYVVSLLQILFDGTRAICHPCWHMIHNIVNRPTSPAPPVAAHVLGSINVPGLSRAANTSRHCMFDNCSRGQLRQVPNSVKVHLLSYYQLYIPSLARICHEHLMNTSVEEIPVNIQSRLSEITPECILDIIRIYTIALERKCFFNLEDEAQERELLFWTGLNRQQFNSLFDSIPSLNQQTRYNRTPRTDLAIYLCKLRTGAPNNRIGTIFNVAEASVARKILKVRTCLLTDFVPEHLGLDHISRNEVIQHGRILPTNIFGNEEMLKAIVIFDGTYLFIEKSSNFLFQRKTYSLHKYRNLIKPFLIVCADGYILDVTGPYPATMTDADIMKAILQNHGEPIEDGAFNYFFEEGDIFILDRGFRDAVPDIESHGYVPHMPPTKMMNEIQLTTENANKSRLITICRWVIEAINGRFKRDYKIFRQRVFNNTVPHIFEDFKIAAALINRFQEPYADSAYVNDFINIINENMNRPNLLADYVITNNVNRWRANFTRLRADSPDVADFPRLTEEDLILFAVGTYHVKLARSYASEHIKATGIYEIEVYREPQNDQNDEDILIRCRIQSRHVQSRTYYTYVKYNTEAEGRTAIRQYYCSCIHGRRTVGSCAHVVSVLYYLGYAQHQDAFNHPALRLNDVLLDLENE